MVHFSPTLSPFSYPQGRMPLSQDNRLTLLIPELLWPQPEDDTFDHLDCPGLCILLARAQRSRRPAQSLEATLTDLFGHSADAPYGALRLLGERNVSINAGDSRWIIADPVHLRHHQESLILADSEQIGMADEEALALADGLNAYFPDLGRFHVIATGRWYLQIEGNSTLDDFVSPPLSTVAGRRIDPLLPEITPNRATRKLLNEIQTFLHAHPVNRLREQEGRMTINSLWLWGAGKLPERVESDFDGVWSTHPLALGLGRAAGIPVHPVPENASTFLQHAAPATRHLIVLENLLGPAQYENGEAYRQAIATLENDWFAPLQKALSSGQLGELHLEATSAYAALSWESRRADQWKFWRRPQSLGALAKTLATEAS